MAADDESGVCPLHEIDEEVEDVRDRPGLVGLDDESFTQSFVEDHDGHLGPLVQLLCHLEVNAYNNGLKRENPLPHEEEGAVPYMSLYTLWARRATRAEPMP